MDLHTFLRVLRTRWLTVVACAVVALLLAVAYNLTAQKKYESSLQLFVSASDSSSASQLVQGSNFTQARVSSYADLVSAPVVLQPVIDELDLSTKPADLAEHVSATVPSGSVLIDVTVDDPNAVRAQQIAAAIGRQFPRTVQQIERTSSDQTVPVKVSVTRSAVVDQSPVSPVWPRNLVLGLVIGLLLGACLAVLRDLLDRKVRSRQAVRELVGGAPVLGAIPLDKDAAQTPLVHLDPHSARAEAFRSLRTNVRFAGAGRAARTIVVTSATEGEGSTTTAANLALVLAELGSTVCLVEADLHHSGQLDFLGVDTGHGLSDVIIGDADLPQVLPVFADQPNLTVLGGGSVPPNPSELLSSTAMHDVLHDLRSEYDYVILDAPPLLPVTDAAILGTLSDGVLLVVGSGLVDRDQVRDAAEALESVQARLLGVALNRVTPGSSKSTYGQGEATSRSAVRPTLRRSGAGAEPRSRRHEARTP